MPLDGSWSNPNLVPPPPTWPGWSGATQLPPPLPPTTLYPPEWRPIALSDAWGVLLADPDGNLVGTPGGLGRGGPVANLLDATRSSTRNL